MPDLETRPDLAALDTAASALTSTELVLADDLDQWAWIELGETLASTMRGALNWWVGDWALYGVNHFDLDAEKAAEMTGFSPATLQQIARVCLAIPAPRRREGLSFWTHEAVCALPAEVADGWLDRAEDEHLSYEQLRAEIRGPRAQVALEVGTPLDIVRALAKKIGKTFTSCVVEDDGRLLLEADGHRYYVTVSPA